MTTIARARELDPDAAALLRKPHSEPVPSHEWLAALYEQHFDRVYRFALMLTRDADLAEEVSAEAFYRAWIGRHQCRDRSAGVSWLLSITRNCALDVLRSKKGDLELGAIPEPEDPGPEPLVEELSDELRARLEEAIYELTPEQQQVIFLRFFDRLPHEEVAARVGRKPGAVRVIQYRALQRLRDLMEAPLGQ